MGQGGHTVRQGRQADREEGRTQSSVSHSVDSADCHTETEGDRKRERERKGATGKRRQEEGERDKNRVREDGLIMCPRGAEQAS